MSTLLFEVGLIAAWAWRWVWPVLVGLAIGFALLLVFAIVFFATGG